MAAWAVFPRFYFPVLFFFLLPMEQTIQTKTGTKFFLPAISHALYYNTSSMNGPITSVGHKTNNKIINTIRHLNFFWNSSGGSITPR